MEHRADRAVHRRRAALPPDHHVVGGVREQLSAGVELEGAIDRAAARAEQINALPGDEMILDAAFRASAGLGSGLDFLCPQNCDIFVGTLTPDGAWKESARTD